MSIGSNNLPNPARISNRHKTDSGFTLVEVLAVLVIIGLISSAVIFTRPPDKPAVQLRAEALVRGANTAAQDSLLSGKPAALALSETGFQFLSYQNGEWVPLAMETSFNRIRPLFTKDDAEIKLTRKLVPIAVFEPTGQSTIFSLRLTGEAHTYVLQSAGDGRVTMARSS